MLGAWNARESQSAPHLPDSLIQTEVLISLDQGGVLTNVQLAAESPPDSELVLSLCAAVFYKQQRGNRFRRDPRPFFAVALNMQPIDKEL